MNSEPLSALSGCGFAQNGSVSYGTWKNYAVCAWKYSGRTYYVTVAIRQEKVNGAMKKAIKQSLKQATRDAAISQLNKNVAVFLVTARGDAGQTMLASLEAITNTLLAAGIAPANTSVISGALNPDSLCLTSAGGMLTYQPVRATEVQSQNAQVREKIEDNENNGNYLLGVIGAILGMLVGVAVNVLVAELSNRIFALLFALIPVAAMFGYKLFKGKMNKAAVVIVILVCIVGLGVMIYSQTVIGIKSGIREETGRDADLKEAIELANVVIKETDFLKESAVEILKYALFMAVGIFIAWRTISGQINSNVGGASSAMVESLRPNPLAAPAQQTAQTNPYVYNPVPPTGGTTPPTTGQF